MLNNVKSMQLVIIIVFLSFKTLINTQHKQLKLMHLVLQESLVIG